MLYDKHIDYIHNYIFICWEYNINLPKIAMFRHLHAIF